jgi:hypothetical protein
MGLIAETTKGEQLPVKITFSENENFYATVYYKSKEYSCDLSYIREKNQSVPVIRFSENSAFLKENYPGVTGPAQIRLKTDWEIFAQQVKQSQIEIWKKQAVNMPMPEVLRLKYHSYDRWHILSKLPYHLVKYHPVLSNLDELDHKNYNPVESDYDDYNSWSIFELSYTQIKKDIKKALDLKEFDRIMANHREQKRKLEEQKRLEHLYRNVASVEKEKTKRSDDDYYRNITVTMKSGKSYKFIARNIFDFGYALNPDYIDGGGVLINIEVYLKRNSYSFNTEDKKKAFRKENPTESGWIWSRYDKPSIALTNEEAQAAMVAEEESKDMLGIRM